MTRTNDFDEILAAIASTTAFAEGVARYAASAADSANANADWVAASAARNPVEYADIERDTTEYADAATVSAAAYAEIAEILRRAMSSIAQIGETL